jgi:hypothetical protein
VSRLFVLIASVWVLMNGHFFRGSRQSEAPAGDVTMEVDGEGDVEGETKEQKKARKEAKKQVSDRTRDTYSGPRVY